MTNSTYTDDQIETAIMGATFPNRLAEMLAYVFADRQRLQAEVEAYRADAERYVWLCMNIDGDFGPTMVWADGWSSEYSDQLIVNTRMSEEDYDRAIDSYRATPNETKEAKS